MTAEPRPASGLYRLREVYYFAPLALCALGLGIWGFLAAPAPSACQAVTFGDALFRTVLLITHSGGSCRSGVALPLQLIIAQVLLPLLLALGTIFAGVKLAIRNVRHDAKLALARSLHGHTIICGLGETGLEAIRQLVTKQAKVIAICLDAAEDAAKTCEHLGVTVIAGDAAHPKTLLAAGCAHARAVVMCTGSDARNMEICLALNAVKTYRPHHLKLFPELRGSWLLETLNAAHAPIVKAGFELHPFRAGQIIARTLLRDPVFQIPSPSPHLLVLGLGDLAAAIIRHAALSTYAIPGTRLHVTAFDATASARPHPPAWQQFITLTAQTHIFGADEEAGRALLHAQLTTAAPDIIIITLPGDDLALQTAILARQTLDQLGLSTLPVFVRVRDQCRLADLLSTITQIPAHPHRLTGFGDLSAVVTPEALFDETLDQLARAVHETYLASGTTDSPACLPWSQLAERFRRASRQAADHIETKLSHAGYRSAPGNASATPLDATAIETMAAAEHHRWCLNLYAAGWRQGATRSDQRRTHPLLVPWEDLPEPTRAANRQSAAEIPAILGRIGRIVERKEESSFL